MSNTKYDALRALSRVDYGITVERAITIIDALAPFFAPDPNAPDAASLVAADADVQIALRDGRKITAIKFARTALTNAGLPADLGTAKRLIDDLVAKSYPNLVSMPF